MIIDHQIWCIHANGVAAQVKLEIAQKTAELVTTSEDNEDDPFADHNDDEKQLESNEVVVKDYEKTDETST